MDAESQVKHKGTSRREGNTTLIGVAGRKRKSGQEVAKKKSKAKWPKTDVRHWLGRIFKNTFTRDGQRHETADWCARVAHKGQRKTFNLQTPNAEAAAARAVKIYRTLIGAGWAAAIAQFDPEAAPKARKPATIGSWLIAVRQTADLRPHTFTNYAQCLRHIAAEIAGVQEPPALDKEGNLLRDEKKKVILRSRFDYRSGGRDAWVAKVDALLLSVLSPAAVQRWKLDYVNRAGTAPDARKRAENSAASLIRCARALFSEKCRRYAGVELTLPDPLPFAGVSIPKRGNTTYQSKIDAAKLIESARKELTGEPFKIFVLGLLCGLRKREIDLLLWSQVDEKKAVIRVERTEFFHPKSEDSVGEIDLDPEALRLLDDWRKTTKGTFVIHSKLKPRHDRSRTNYRCEPHFEKVYAWLRKHGVTAKKPLHELRKELGALLASSQGIFAAQAVLRHAQISTTAAYYTDKKRRITAGLGALLVPHQKSP